MAERFWPGKSPLGHRFNKNNVVVGVVGDVRKWGLSQAVMPQAYFPIFSMYPHQAMNLVVKSPLPAGSVATAVRQATRAIDPALAIFRVRSMDDVVSDSLGTSRFQTVALGIFGSLALLLALVGIYSVMTYAVSQRTHEMGIRMALGASETDVLRLVLREGGRLTLFGIVAGLAVSPLLTRLLSGLLYDVTPLDPITFGTVAILLAATSLAATYLPARRATRVDPLVALQAE
ncbi:MAG: FtsX-like permease family protein [Acidobacteriota bacterium]|nr:FtsX-like permease family protein [Acidobacteriota bacterium]